jgi:uncharacterized protein YkuJ
MDPIQALSLAKLFNRNGENAIQITAHYENGKVWAVTVYRHFKEPGTQYDYTTEIDGISVHIYNIYRGESK